MIEMNCPGCAQALHIEEKYAGTTGKCNHCGQEIETALEAGKEFGEKCPNCKSNLDDYEELDFIDWITELALKTNVEIRIVSTETEEGNQFYTGFGGIGAFLRY